MLGGLATVPWPDFGVGWERHHFTKHVATDQFPLPWEVQRNREYDDRVGVEVRHLLNVDNLIWGSDFPHQESDWPHSMEIIEKAFENAPADVRKRMTCGNAVEFFHLKE